MTDLTGGVCDVVGAANDVSDVHVVIIHHHGQDIDGRAVAAQDNEVIDLRVLHGDGPLHLVVPRRRAAAVNLEGSKVRNQRQSVDRLARAEMERV